jgi:hypothetical protein
MLYLVVKLMSQQAMTTHILLVVRVGFVVPKQGNVPCVGSAIGMIGSWLSVRYSDSYAALFAKFPTIRLVHATPNTVLLMKQGILKALRLNRTHRADL